MTFEYQVHHDVHLHSVAGDLNFATTRDTVDVHQQKDLLDERQ
jgi:hypothetical protein